MRHLGLLPLVATAMLVGANRPSKQSAHAVTLHLSAFTNEVVVVHIASKPAGLALSTDPIERIADSLTVRTPVDVRVSAAVQRLQLTTEGNLAIRVRFDEGASEKERALAPWGRRLTFVRTPEGDLRPEAELLPAQPKTSR
jgi:hypothetical protein